MFSILKSIIICLSYDSFDDDNHLPLNKQIVRRYNIVFNPFVEIKPESSNIDGRNKNSFQLLILKEKK